MWIDGIQYTESEVREKIHKMKREIAELKQQVEELKTAKEYAEFMAGSSGIAIRDKEGKVTEVWEEVGLK